MSNIKLDSSDTEYSASRISGIVADMEAVQQEIKSVKYVLSSNSFDTGSFSGSIMTDLTSVGSKATSQHELISKYSSVLFEVSEILGDAENKDANGGCISLPEAITLAVTTGFTSAWNSIASWWNSIWNKKSKSANTVVVRSKDYGGEEDYNNMVRQQEKEARESYQSTIDSFDVEHNSKYQPRNGNTYCNIYVQDVTEARNCAVPKNMTADSTAKWFADPERGGQAGWSSCSAEEAQAMANKGYTVVAASETSEIVPRNGHGHVAMVVPQQDGDTGVMISQAGGTNYAHTSVNKGFGSKSTVHYYYYKG